MFSDGRAKLEIRGSAAVQIRLLRLEYGQGLYPQPDANRNGQHTPWWKRVGQVEYQRIGWFMPCGLDGSHNDHRVDEAVVQITLETLHPGGHCVPASPTSINVSQEPQVDCKPPQVRLLTKVQFYVG